MNIKLTLAFAQGHWDRDLNNGNWIVQNEKGDVLWELPPGFDEKKVMSAIRLGRKYELEAFNIGIAFGKKTAEDRESTMLIRLQNQVRSLAAMNEELSNQLEKHIEG